MKRATIPSAGAFPDDFPPSLVGQVSLVDSGPVVLVWQNELGGRTFQLGSGAGRRFLKWSPIVAPDLRLEATKLRWAIRFVTVPRVIDVGADSRGSWLLTAGLPGANAVDPRWVSDPAAAVRAIGQGLRELHDAIPVDECPFTWSVEDRLSDVRSRAEVIDPAGWHAEHRELGVTGALDILASPPGIDHLVVCHGDACAPNTMVADDGTVSGRVDLGALGVADRWADLAVATWSTRWNYGPGWEQALLDAYGIAADPERTRYYRLLWDLGP